MKTSYYEKKCLCALCSPEYNTEWICDKWFERSRVKIETRKRKALIEIKQNKKDFKANFTFRAKIGIYIGVLIGLVDLKFIDPINEE